MNNKQRLLNAMTNCDTLPLERQPTLKEWKLLLRLRSLKPSRYTVCVTIDEGVQDWTVQLLGKVER